MEQTEIEEIYAEIQQLPIELAPDPTILGAIYITEIIAKCRNHLNRVSQILLRMSRERRLVKFTLSGEETILSAEKDRLLAEDDDVKRAANIRDREAIANTKLRERLNRIHVLKNELLDLETVEKAVKLIHEELVRTSNEIKTQRSLLHADRYSGAGYGDESNLPRDGKGRVLPQSDDIDIAELDALVADGIKEQKAATEAAETSSEEGPVLEIEVQVPEGEKAPAAQDTAKVDGKDLASFLSDEPTPVPEPKETKPVKVNHKPADPDDDFLQGLLANI